MLMSVFFIGLFGGVAITCGIVVCYQLYVLRNTLMSAMLSALQRIDTLEKEDFTTGPIDGKRKRKENNG